MDEIQPIFLIAVPQMGDPNFSRAVVLVLQNDEDGAIGLVINRPTQISLERFADGQGLTCHKHLADTVVFRGGPVQTERGWILHADDSVDERQEVIPGLYVSTGSDTLGDLMKRGSKPLRLYLGYAGWGAGQLEKEMVEGAWITAEAHPKYVFDTPPDKLWNQILADLGVDPNRLMVGTGLH